ncbi:MAG: lipase family alpha/beta hydrolase [Pyrinomonadaceae bacterium]
MLSLKIAGKRTAAVRDSFKMLSFLVRKSLILLALAVFVSAAAAQRPSIDGKAPVIIIPGLTGSDLYNSRTGEHVWFRPSRSKDDDIRLPISPDLARSRDLLEPRDILRGIRFWNFVPEIEIYERLIGALSMKGGYREGDWERPARGGDKDTFYVFPYDWRRDNVENARLLVQKIETLKRKLGKPQLKFNVLAHSMGGLIARYAAMYGDSDIPAGRLNPAWSGARHFDKIFMLGTPNTGSVSALNALLNGFSYIGGGINIPFVRDITRFDVFTLPSVYQLLPHNGALKVYDENLKPIEIDLFDPAVWETYNWGIWKDDDYTRRFSPDEVRNARSYFDAVLLRAKRFQQALNANGRTRVPVKFYLVGSDCKDTLNGFVLRQDGRRDRWITQFKIDSFTNSAGEKITAEQLRPLLIDKGDSVVLKRSLIAKDLTENGLVLPIAAEIFQCEGHTKLVTSTDVQDKLLDMLGAVAP